MVFAESVEVDRHSSCFETRILQEVYQSLPYSMMTMFVMTLGELNYSDTFMPWTDYRFATSLNIFFVLFVLGMPIIVMNLLVSNQMVYLCPLHEVLFRVRLIATKNVPIPEVSLANSRSAWPLGILTIFRKMQSWTATSCRLGKSHLDTNPFFAKNTDYTIKRRRRRRPQQ